eukprot:CAMPEP_0172713922 /NCGR_PEP_ID=MMETSP1074-20121228/64133_1 /TAXON_ID=2916 /ORGANISM="Ceratium fusus, Strain PA161109" /LENGTH=129 /DNA_ID=CAMNT_0013538169 /DNA_START=12 /DNA_END=398 /DNA_ORIENTATION=+
MNLPIDLGDWAGQVVMDWIGRPAKAVRSSNNIYGKLMRQSYLHSFRLRNVLRFANDDALGRGEIIVTVASVWTCDAITRATRDVKELLVVGVAASLLRLVCQRFFFGHAEVVDPADMALLARHLVIIEA